MLLIYARRYNSYDSCILHQIRPPFSAMTSAIPDSSSTPVPVHGAAAASLAALAAVEGGVALARVAVVPRLAAVAAPRPTAAAGAAAAAHVATARGAAAAAAVAT